MDRSNFSRYVIAAVTAVFLLAVFAYRVYEKSQRFEMTGVVEGFYGNPWSHDARVDMIRFMGDVGLQHYFYAPKDDPFHRQQWREPYTGEHLDRFKTYIREAEDAGVTLWYAISPGLSIVYSSEEDYQDLLRKLNDMINLGVGHVALFLDDVPERLQHEGDKARFANLAEAHVYLINKLHADLKSRGIELVVCPTTYTAAWGNRDYVRILGEGIAREIPLFWTGNDIAPARITREDARYWAQLLNRKPLLWDNFPVNDFETWRPIVGPLDGRDPALSQNTRGIIANPMDAPYLSMIPLYTVAEYARRPFSYDQSAAWRRAIEHLAGNEGYQVLRPLLLMYADYGWTDNVFTPLFTPGRSLNIQTISEALDLFDDTLDELRSPRFNDNEYIQNIIPELEPFALASRARFDFMMADGMYRVDPEGFLVFQRSMEEIEAGHQPVNVDGSLNEWRAEEFRKLTPSIVLEPERVQAAFRFYDDTLYVAISVETNVFMPEYPAGWSGGDQILLILDQTPRRPATWVEPTDFMMLIRPPVGSEPEYLTGSMYLTPFSQRGISDITMRTISGFFEHFMGDIHPNIAPLNQGLRVAQARSQTGYTTEIAIPLVGQQEIAVGLSVNSAFRQGDTTRNVNFMLQHRPYIGNAHTWVPLVLR
ncbi:MAG: beta-N-acetylglucosaminidase domain-containing protein [Balneolales bacterium]|nr:beta-N-acetylglucosaminidase domain-containing protein [Balneolales bacterium]